MRNNKAQFFIFGILAFALVLIIVLVLSDMTVRVAAKTNQNTWEAEMEQIAIAATNDLVLNPAGGMLVKIGGQPELNDHLISLERTKSFDYEPDHLNTTWRTGRCNATVGVYWLDGKPIKGKEDIGNGTFGKFAYRRLVVILDDKSILPEKGTREVGYIDLEVAC